MDQSAYWLIWQILHHIEEIRAFKRNRSPEKRKQKTGLEGFLNKPSLNNGLTITGRRLHETQTNPYSRKIMKLPLQTRQIFSNMNNTHTNPPRPASARPNARHTSKLIYNLPETLSRTLTISCGVERERAHNPHIWNPLTAKRSSTVIFRSAFVFFTGYNQPSIKIQWSGFIKPKT